MFDMNMHALEIANLNNCPAARREPVEIWLIKPVKKGDPFLFCIYHTLSVAIK